TAKASEEEVLRQLLDGLYRFGQRHWRYGFCRVVSADGSCTFGSTVVSPRDFRLKCDRAADPPICWCPARTLIEGDPTFNFGDCFKFSDTLQLVAGTTGLIVGQSEIEGETGLGFGTRPELRSLDPAFAGNLRCGYRPKLPCAYVFGNHSLVFLDPLFFDSTFGRVYQSDSEPIAASVIAGEGDVQFPSFWACLRPGDYGTFPFYQEAPSCKRDPSRPATFG